MGIKNRHLNDNSLAEEQLNVPPSQNKEFEVQNQKQLTDEQKAQLNDLL